MPPKTKRRKKAKAKAKARASKPTTAPTASADPAQFNPNQSAAADLHGTQANVLDELDETLEVFLDKPLPYRLRLAVSVFKEFADNVRAASEACNFQRRAYLGAREDAIAKGLVIGEEEQWIGDKDGPLQLLCGRKPGGPVEVVKLPIPASERYLREAIIRSYKLRSFIISAVREVMALYPRLIDSNSALARLCDKRMRCERDVPEWARMPGLEASVGPGFYLLASGDLAVQWYWSVLERELIQLAAAIERRERDAAGGSADQIELDPLVTLNQLGALAGKSKRQMQRHVKDGDLPDPDIRGGRGKANRWYWRKVRPAVQKIAERSLPEMFPASRIILR